MPSLADLTRSARILKQSRTPARDGVAALNLNPLGQFGGGLDAIQGAYGAWLAGTPMSAALPRDIQSFLAHAFGPLEPIMPQPIDPPDEVSGKPELRRLQYPVSWNLPVGIPGSEGIKVAPFQVSRQYAEQYSVVRACLRVRKDEMLGIKYDIVPDEPTEKEMRENTELREDWTKRRKQMLAFWKKPDVAYPSFVAWFSAMLEELFVTDSISVSIVPPRKGKQGPFGNSKLAFGGLFLLDGTTIRPLYDGLGGPPAPPNPAYQQYIWGVPRSDLMQVITEEDAFDAAEEINDYSSSQLLYLPYCKRVWTPYGFSPVEQSLLPEAIGLSRQVYFLDYFREGSIPGVYVVPGPEIASAAQRRQLMGSLNAIAGDIGQKFKVIVLPQGSHTEPTKDVKLADGSDITLIEMVTMCFAVFAEEINMVPGGKTGGLGGASHGEQQQEIRTRNRALPLANWLKENLFDFVGQQVFGQVDMEWAWTGLQADEDRQQQSAIHKIYLDEGVLSRDEVRDDLGLPPWGLPMTGVPTFTTTTGLTPLDPSVQEQNAQLQSAIQTEYGIAPPGAKAPPPQQDEEQDDSSNSNGNGKNGNGKGKGKDKKGKNGNGKNGNGSSNGNGNGNGQQATKYASLLAATEMLLKVCDEAPTVKP